MLLRAGQLDWIRAEFSRVDGRSERLSPRELELLGYLVDHADVTVSRAELMERVWGYAATVASRAADTAVRRLREKIELDPERPDHVLTVFGEGYRFVHTSPEAHRSAPLVDRDLFVGRTAELDELTAALAGDGRAVGVVGPPGIGKTRLAVHVAAQLASTLRGGSTVIDLTEARDLSQVAATVAVGLGIEAADTGAAMLRRAGQALRGRGPCLLMLDNCEGVCRLIGEVLAGWRTAAPDARILTTSRESVVGLEIQVALGPMTRADAVALFEAMAVRVRPDVRLDGAEDVVEALVERLERLPLAIALAAGRTGALSPKAILDRLDDRFRVLASRTRDGDSRQRTLQASVDGSWELLGPAEREAFLACSVFHGGFDLAAASAVLGEDAQGVLDSLRSRSLLEVVPAPPHADPRRQRYGGYAFVQAYARDRLAADPVALERASRRHAEHFAARVSATPDHARGHELAPDRANLIAAVERATAAGWGLAAGTCAIGALDVVGLSGPLELCAQICRTALRCASLDPGDRHRLMLRLAQVSLWTGDGEPHALLDEAERLARESGDANHLAHVLGTRALIIRNRQSPGLALPLLVEAVAVAERADAADPSVLCSILGTLGAVYRDMGQLDDAIEVLARGLEIARASPEEIAMRFVPTACGTLAMIKRRQGQTQQARELYQVALDAEEREGDRRGIATALVGVGNLEVELGNWEDARRAYRQALVTIRDVGVRDLEARIHGNLGLCARAEGRLDEARRHLDRAIEIFDLVGEPVMAAQGRGTLGELELADGEVGRAVAVLGDAIRCLREIGEVPSATELAGAYAEALIAAGRLDQAKIEIERAETDARAMRHPFALAQVLARRGLIELALGVDPARTLVEAETLAGSAGPTSPTGRALQTLRAAIHPSS